MTMADKRTVYDLLHEWSDGEGPFLDEDVDPRAYDFVTYEVYCEALDLAAVDRLTEDFFLGVLAESALDEGLWDRIKSWNVPGKLVSFFKDVKRTFEDLAVKFKADVSDFVEAFKQRDVLTALKAFGFSLSRIAQGIRELTGLLRKGLMAIFQEMAKSGVVQKIRSGAIKVDDYLDEHPLLKKVGGLAIAALLFVIWVNMTFIGDFEFDFDLGTIAAALHGSFSIADLFFSPAGLAMLALFGTGAMGLGVSWFGTTGNIIVGLAYTGLARLRASPKAQELAAKLRTRMGH